MRLAWLVLPLVVLVTSTSVVAQEQNQAQRRATARALFSEGVAFAGEERWAEAADRFRRTMDLHPTPVVAFNLAHVLIELGRLVEASEHLLVALRSPNAEAAVREEARSVLDEIRPRIGRLRITVNEMPPGARVERDGSVLSRAELEVAVPVDPGPHLVQLVRAGETLDEETIDVGPGASETVRLRAELSPAAAAATIDTSHTDAGGGGGGGSVAEEGWFWVVISVLVVGAAVGIGIGVTTLGGERGDPVPGDLDPPILRGMVFP